MGQKLAAAAAVAKAQQVGNRATLPEGTTDNIASGVHWSDVGDAKLFLRNAKQADAMRSAKGEVSHEAEKVQAYLDALRGAIEAQGFLPTLSTFLTRPEGGGDSQG